MPDEPRAEDGEWTLGADLRSRPAKLARTDSGRKIHELDPAKLDAAWSADPLYISKDGAGETTGKREGVGEWMKSNRSEPMEAPSAEIDSAGRLAFNDGRHRTRMMIDAGRKTIPVALSARAARNAGRHGLLAAALSGKDAVGKEGDWESLNLPSAESIKASIAQRPSRISRQEALDKLSTPYSKTDPAGNTIEFGARLKQHLEGHADASRARFLPHMEATVEHPAEIWHENTDEGPRFRHISVFTASDGTRTFGVVSHRVGETEGNVVTATPKTHQSVNQWRKGKLLYASY